MRLGGVSFLRLHLNAAVHQMLKPTPEVFAANPSEKNILWRILQFLRLNVQPVFVADGQNRPEKRGRSVSCTETMITHDCDARDVGCWTIWA